MRMNRGSRHINPLAWIVVRRETLPAERLAAWQKLFDLQDDIEPELHAIAERAPLDYQQLAEKELARRYPKRKVA